MAVPNSRRWAIVTLAAGFLLAGAWIGSVFLRARRVLQDHTLDVERVLTPAPRARPAIFDPEEPGDAWEPLARAFLIMDPRSFEPREPTIALRLAMPALPTTALDGHDERAAALCVKDPEFDLIRHALRRRECRPPCSPGWTVARSTEAVVNELLLSAKALHEKGKDLEAMERVVMAIGLAGEVARHGDYQHLDSFWQAEVDGAALARTLLASHSLSAADLSTVARWLGRLEASRPALEGVIGRNGALSRRIVLENFENLMVSHNGPFPDLHPTGRDLWTRLLNRARRVTGIDRGVRAVEGIDALPSWEREKVAARILQSIDLEICDAFEGPSPELYAADAAAQVHTVLLRVAVAIARYYAERGALPASLQDLVPRHLAVVATCPFTGAPLRYEAGRLWVVIPRAGPPQDALVQALAPERFDWRVARKTR